MSTIDRWKKCLWADLCTKSDAYRTVVMNAVLMKEDLFSSHVTLQVYLSKVDFKYSLWS